MNRSHWIVVNAGFATTLIVAGLLSFSSGFGCQSSQPYMGDAATDLSVFPQVTHVGKVAPTCCMLTAGSSYVVYLANPIPGRVDAMGNDKPATGELHIADRYGADYTLGASVTAQGYGFTPDGAWLVFLAKAKDSTFSLNFAALEGPLLHQPTVVTPIARGMAEDTLSNQAFFTPSGRYLIAGAAAPGVVNSPDLHVIDAHSATDVYQLGNGAFSYLELVTNDDVMIFENDTASPKPGTPSVEGLYIIPLSAAANGATPSLIDTGTVSATLAGLGDKLLYTKVNGDLMLYDLTARNFVKLASNVLYFSAGSGDHGPIAYIANDLSLHVQPILEPELAATPPGSVDLFTQFVFSPDGQSLYYFKNMLSQDNTGDLYYMSLEHGTVGQTHLVATRASTNDVDFVTDRLIYLRNLDATGSTGDVVSSAYDGSSAFSMCDGAATGEVLVAYPPPQSAPTGPKKPYYGPKDLAVEIPPPVFANLSDATLIANATIKPIDASKPVVGSLSFGLSMEGRESVIAEKVQTGGFAFSDDGFVLLYVSGVSFDTKLRQYSGTLGLFQTRDDVTPVVPSLVGASQLGPITERSLFVSAPKATPAGIYFVKY